MFFHQLDTGFVERFGDDFQAKRRANFTNDIPWLHLDIAGTAWTKEGTFERSCNPKGATGFGVRTLVKFLMEAPNK